MDFSKDLSHHSRNSFPNHVTQIYSHLQPLSRQIKTESAVKAYQREK